MIRIGVTSQSKTAREASDANAKQMTNVLAAIKEAGIADRDVQTSRLSLQPQYDPKQARRRAPARLPGHQSGDGEDPRYRQAAVDLDHAIAAGANEMSGIEFMVSEQSKLLDQARDEAIADARRKAELYAKAAGVKLGRVMAISRKAPLRRRGGDAGVARRLAPGGARRADAARRGDRHLRIDVCLRASSRGIVVVAGLLSTPAFCAADELVSFDSGRYLVGYLQQRLARERGEAIKRRRRPKRFRAICRSRTGEGPFAAVVHLHGCGGLSAQRRIAAESNSRAGAMSR